MDTISHIPLPARDHGYQHHLTSCYSYFLWGSHGLGQSLWGCDGYCLRLFGCHGYFHCRTSFTSHFCRSLDGSHGSNVTLLPPPASRHFSWCSWRITPVVRSSCQGPIGCVSQKCMCNVLPLGASIHLSPTPICPLVLIRKSWNSL